MFNLILLAYRDTVSLLAKKPLLVLLLVFVALVNIPLTFAMGRLDRNSLNYDLFFDLSRLIAVTLSVYLYWVIFNSKNVTTLLLSEWFKKNYIRSLIQYVGGFFLFFPFYTALRLIFGDDGLAVKPGHDILMISMSVWFFIAMDLAVLWLCFQNDGFFQNVKNSITDAFRNFGGYLILRLLSVAFAYLSQIAMFNFMTFTTGLVCGLSVLASILLTISWMALAFGFLEIRKREQLLIIIRQSKIEN
jgi:hypothetical protein